MEGLLMFRANVRRIQWNGATDIGDSLNMRFHILMEALLDEILIRPSNIPNMNNAAVSIGVRFHLPDVVVAIACSILLFTALLRMYCDL